MSITKKRCLAKKIFRHEMNMLQSEGHGIYGVRANKISLIPFDSKRYITENGIDAHAYGYRLTDEEYVMELLDWKKRVRGHNQQLLTNEASFWPILYIIQYRFTWFGNRFFDVVGGDPDGISCTFATAFQLTPLVKITHENKGGNSFSVHSDRSVVRGRRLEINGLFYGLCRFFACEASDFAVSEAETSAGNRTTHSEDL